MESWLIRRPSMSLHSFIEPADARLFGLAVCATEREGKGVRWLIKEDRWCTIFAGVFLFGPIRKSSQGNCSN